MKNFTLKTLLMSVLLCVGVSAWADDELFYTLTPAKGSNNAFASACDVTISGITWNLTGNSTMLPWRVGGRSITKEDRTVYSKTAMGSAITKVELTVGTASSITVNSLKLTVASDADFNNVLDEVSETFKASSTITFTPTSGTEWVNNAYYKFTFNVTVSGNSNKFVEFKDAKFYKNAIPSISFAEESQTASMEEVSTITVAATTVSAGGATVSYSSSDETVATVAAGGVVTLLKAGKTTITASITVNDVEYTASYELTVIEKEQAEAELAFDETKCDGVVGQVFSAPNLTTADGLDGAITYTSSDESVATVNPSTGAVNLLSYGTVTITATSEETVNFKAGEASYTITVTDPSVVTTYSTIDFSSLGLENGVQYTTHNYSGVTVTFGDGANDGKYYDAGTGIRTYASGNITVSAGGKTITSIVMTFASTSGNYATSSDATWDFGTATYSKNVTTWTGSATSVKVTRGSASSHWRLQKVTVYYKTSRYTRSVTNGNYGTICLPFGVNEEGISGATFYTVGSKTMDGEDVKYISLEEATSLTAGVGYIFQASANEIQLTPNGTTVEKPVTGGALVGTFTDVTAIPNGNYMLSGNKLYKAVNDYGKMNAFRAYIDLSKVSKASEAKGRVLFADGYDEATGIRSIATDAAENGTIYNMAGQRVNAAYKGIVIKNGKKFINK